MYLKSSVEVIFVLAVFTTLVREASVWSRCAKLLLVGITFYCYFPICYYDMDILSSSLFTLLIVW